MQKLNGEIVPALLHWYDYNARILPWRGSRDPYRIWISEIMLQQTRVEAVKPYYDRFLEAVPSIADLAAVDDGALMKLWEGLGYYNRARNLKKAAVQIMERFDGQMPADYGLLLSLPGIGEYTAGAIGSIAFGLPVPAVDGNVLRIIMRLTGSEEDIQKQTTKKKVIAMLQDILPADRCGDFNQALMELGATVCLPNGAPDCAFCPWDTRCQAYRRGLIDQIPVKTQKKARRIETRTVFLMRYRQRIALHRRADSGLLAGLWEFPNVAVPMTAEQLREELGGAGMADCSIEKLKDGKHIFSHVEWHMAAYEIEFRHDDVLRRFRNLTWVTPAQLEWEYAVPSAFEFIRKQRLSFFIGQESDRP